MCKQKEEIMKKQNMIMKIIGLWLITLIGLSSANAKEMQQSDVINFPDKSFEKAIREIINKPKGDVLYSDVSKITKIVFNDKDIKLIEGIQYFKSLKTLNLGHNKITDISAIKNLIKLERLELYFNKITDISAVNSLVKLEDLVLDKNKVIDISAVKGLTNLENLSFWDNEITDISAIKNLVKLKILELSNNKITDISVLKNLVNLEYLFVESNEITDISIIKNLKKIKRLGVDSDEYYLVLSSLPNLSFLSFERGSLLDTANYSKFKNITLSIYWTNTSGKGTSREIKLDKIKHLGKVTLDEKFINKYAELKRNN